MVRATEAAKVINLLENWASTKGEARKSGLDIGGAGPRNFYLMHYAHGCLVRSEVLDENGKVVIGKNGKVVTHVHISPQEHAVIDAFMAGKCDRKGPRKAVVDAYQAAVHGIVVAPLNGARLAPLDGARLAPLDGAVVATTTKPCFQQESTTLAAPGQYKPCTVNKFTVHLRPDGRVCGSIPKYKQEWYKITEEDTDGQD